MKFNPAIKWSGSKRAQSTEILSFITKDKYDIYYEPFCGGCSVLFQILHSHIKFNRYVCSDINLDLINLWNEIKNNPETIIENYDLLWNELNKDKNIKRKVDFYNCIRTRFNDNKSPSDFMFLMRTAVNGMPRYNSKGNFNTSFHLTRNGIIPDKFKKDIIIWSNAIKNVDFIHCNYTAIAPNVNDFIYFDPPYYNTKGMYFGGIKLNEFWEYLAKCNCDYILSFDGRTNFNDKTYSVPENLYNRHVYTESANSSFRRTLQDSSKVYVQESLYIKV
jgi:DNA adenine methylase